MSEFVTEDRTCGQCGTPVEGFESEEGDVMGGRLGERVVLSAWITLRPCGHMFKQAVKGAEEML